MHRTLRERIVLAALALAAPLTALAASPADSTPAPFYEPADAVAGLYRFAAAPQAKAFHAEALRLVDALKAHCAGPASLAAARTAWTRATGAWERLSSVTVGPLIERRSARQIDFQPLRVPLLQRAIARAPANAADMERVGTPAKGLPALEYLLWTQPVAPSTPACTFAVLAAEDVLTEADALAHAFDAAAKQPPEDEQAGGAFAEFVNQWLGGLERLRWAGMEKPRREAATRHRPPAYARAASGRTGTAWAQQWAALRALAVQGDAAMPAPGQGVVPIETYLRGRGQLALAQRWAAAIGAADEALRDLAPAQASRMTAAGQALADLKRLMEGEVAPALEITIGFSDADGD